MNERPSPEEIKQGLRTGYSFDPRTPGLQAAARDLLRPIIESMDGQEIVYVCRFPRLMRVAYLEVDDEGWRAKASPIALYWSSVRLEQVLGMKVLGMILVTRKLWECFGCRLARATALGSNPSTESQTAKPAEPP